MELTITQAAVQWGVTRQYLHRKIKDGDVSKLHNGKVDSSEMLRVFGEPKKAVTVTEDTDGYTKLHLERQLLEERIKHLELTLSMKNDEISERKGREKWLTNQVDSLTESIKLIQHKPSEPVVASEPTQEINQTTITPVVSAEPEPEKVSLWRKMFGG